MNVKAERIEHLVQIINRNLSLAYAGHLDGVTPIEAKELQRVDTVVFGHDKFAFEMVHFVKGSNDKVVPQDPSSVADVWESNFIQGLEALLVECAVVNDDIERDCFVSRVYCWFTEKLSERRELPRRAPKAEYLRSAIERLEGTHSHTLKGLEDYDPDNTFGASIRAKSKALLEQPDGAEGDGTGLPADEVKSADDRDLPLIELPPSRKEKLGSRKVPQYVKSGFPNVLQPPEDANPGLFPKIPGADENYGMVYNKPETEAERTMHELWMARRRQEAFEFKTQQHLALVMDRLALHKSRLESDALRRQESGQLLKQRDRPSTGTTDNSPRTPRTPRSRTSRSRSPKSGTATSASAAIITTTTYQVPKNRMLKPVAAPPSPTRTSRGRRRSPSRQQQQGEQHAAESHLLEKASKVEGTGAHTAHKLEDRHLTHSSAQETTLIIQDKGLATPTSIPRASRSSVSRKSQTGFLPMKFKNDLPDSFQQQQDSDRERFYMQLSDSDDDDKPARVARGTRKAGGGTGGGGGAGGANKKKPSGGGASAGAAKAEANFKHEAPVLRERPVSATMFHRVSANDPEFKVHYRHTNYRRMPLTEHQEQWLDEREQQRIKKSEEAAKALRDAASAKAEKKNAKDSKKDKKDNKKDKKDKKGDKKTDAAATAAAAAAAAGVKPPSKYKSAAHFMETFFPNFEGDDEDTEAMGPMRTAQLNEVAEIMEVFEDANVPIKESALRKALVVPQDRPEAVCLESLREGGEGLMINPLPKELWRKFVMGGKKGGKKKGGKKKKK